jgi:hypothetical protein
MHQELILHNDDGQLLYVNNADPGLNWVVDSGSTRDLQLVGGGRVMVGNSSGWNEYQLSDGARVVQQTGFSGIQSVHRLANGNTVLAAVDGNNILLHIASPTGEVQQQITYPGYAYVRLVRPTAAGTFLVTADLVVFEGNDQGDILWQVDILGDNAWKAMRLANGNTVVATGYGATLQVFDAQETLIQTIGGPDQAAAARAREIGLVQEVVWVMAARTIALLRRRGTALPISNVRPTFTLSV